MTLKEKIAEMVVSLGGVSFVELSGIPGFGGDREMCIESKNIVLWCGVSREACEAIEELKAEGVIEARPTSRLVYMLDGRVPALPLAKQNRAYKSPHWCPITFSTPRRKRHA